MWKRSTLSSLVLVVGLGLPALADDSCKGLLAGFANLNLDKGIELVAAAAAKPYKQLYEECDKNDMFDGMPLPTYKKKPLHCSTDKNNVTYVKRFPDGTIIYRAKMAVDVDGSPASKIPNNGSDQPVTSLKFDSGESFNAEEVSFIVIPQFKDYKPNFGKDSGLELGDVAVVFKGGLCSLAIVADQGPAFRLGEASVKTHEDFNNHQCVKPGQHPCLHIIKGGDGLSIPAGVTYIVFPGPLPRPFISETVSDVIAEQAAKKAALFFDKFKK